MRYYVIAGEASGDVHASKLMKGLKELDTDAHFRFWGGDNMVAVGGADNLVSHYKDGAFMGVVEVLANAKTILGRMKRCKKDVVNHDPDVLILVDYGGFNMKIAKYANEHGIKTYFYIAPKVWAWNQSRTKKIKKYIDELFVIFPFEVPFFKKWGIDAHYCGNPITDEIEVRNSNMDDLSSFQKSIGLGEKAEGESYIALLAGSRKQEIHYNLPFMVELANAMPENKFILAGVPWLDKSVYDKYLVESKGNIIFVVNKTYETLKSSDVAIVTSGTATLETALLGVPEIVCYKSASITHFLASVFVNLKLYSLVNIILGKESVREFIQDYMVVEDVKSELTSLLSDTPRRREQEADYIELKKLIGDSGASERFAKKIFDLLQ